MGVAPTGGDGEMCAGSSLESLVPLRLRGFFAVTARAGVWRLPGFFVAAGASDSDDEDRFMLSAVFVFFGTGVQWLDDFNSLAFIGSLASAFLALFTRSGKLAQR
jgi:hypothetical protein